MKTSLRKIFTVAVLFLLSDYVSGQAFSATYLFGSAGTTTGRTDPTPAPVIPGVTLGSFIAVAPTGNPNNLGANPNAAQRFSFQGWPTGATNGSDIFTGSINTGQYYEVTVAPQLNMQLTLDSINFALQRSGSGVRQYAVRSSADNYATNLPASIALTSPPVTALQVVANDVFQVTDATTTAVDGSKITISGIINVTGPVTYRFYAWNAEAAGGTFSIDNVRFSGSATLIPGSPVLTLSTAAVNFPATNLNSSAALSFTVQGENLSVPVELVVTAPYAISETENGTYDTSLSIDANDVSTPKPFYIRFTPTAIGPANGAVTVSSGSSAPRTITLTGEGVDPLNLVFNFNNCTSTGAPGSGFVSYSVSGAQKWACSGFGNGSNGVDVNGFSAAALDNEDWLISPALHVSALNLPVLSFYSRGEFAGPSLHLLISTDYDGTGNPVDFTWTDLQANFPPLTNVWTFTDGINLTAFKSFPEVYVAFKYTSSAELGAARWTIDNVSVNDRTKLLSINPASLSFNEISAGNNSSGQPVSLQSVGYGDLNITAPAGYLLSLDNAAFAPSVQINSATAEAGATIYARFSPPSKALKFEGKLNFSGTGIDSNFITLTGSSFPRSETFDVGAYNLSFFGSNATNKPTPQKITTQITNISTVIQRLNLDVIGFEELSSDSALGVLISTLPNYASITSNRWSYSFEPPDPDFPAQKVGFIYNAATMELVDSRVMFVGLFDSVRNGTSTALNAYPTGTASSFWASGRLPFMATFRTTIGGVTKLIRLIDIHAKSASDAASYNRRAFDIKVLKDSLDAYYKNDNIVLVGDYNDRVIGSINVGAQSPYKIFVDDNGGYSALTLPLDQAGRVSFISGTAMIDHIIISNELAGDYIASSADIEDPRTCISGYNANTGSDHLAVYARFMLNEQVLPVTVTRFNAQTKDRVVVVSWATSMELNNRRFIIERSADGRNFIPISTVKGAGNSNNTVNYQLVDSLPLPGTSFYRLTQEDYDGKLTLSDVVSINRTIPSTNKLLIYPNPVGTNITFHFTSTSTVLDAQVVTIDGIVLLQATGNVAEINQKVNQQIGKLKAGTYIFKIGNADGHQSARFIKQ